MNFDDLSIEEIVPEVSDQPGVDPAVWSKDDELTTAIGEFISSSPTPLSQGIEVTNLPTKLRFLADKAAVQRLVTRQEQRIVVKKVFDISRTWLSTDSPAGNEGKNAELLLLTIRGSPGIGKSWSAILYLKHLLTDTNKRPIIFESGSATARETRLLTFESGSWIAYNMITPSLPKDWYNFPGKDVIIDPAQFPQGEKPQPSPLIECAGHIFVPVSPDDTHLGGTHKIASSRKQLVLGPWTFREISVAWPQMVYTKKPDQGVYEAKKKLVRERFEQFGGLPRYLIDDEKAGERKLLMTPANAKIHEKEILSALTSARINDRKKVLTLFFTIFPGVNENGDYDPSIEHSTVEFVSRGALKAAGQVVFHQINSDVTWRTASDASSVGLAFEAVCLMFLHMGTQGMQDMGITVHCRELLKSCGEPRPAWLYLGFCPYTGKPGSSELTPIIEAADEAEFFDLVKKSGDTMEISDNNGGVKLTSQSAVSFPPPGLANVDGMSGPRLGFQMTLRENHPPSGVKYLHQRNELNVRPGVESAIVFMVPYRRFTEGWTKFQNFRWKEPSDDEDLPQTKRRRGASGAINAADNNVEAVTKTQCKKARKSLRQFVLAFTVKETHQPLISAPRTIASEGL